jgi:peptidoglycan/xylan/chitin deacetylase (PgdA/CDA1 family)
MADWADLTRELDLWRDAGRTASFWWRDDDAGPDDDRLAPFLEQRRCLDVPVALAVVPAWLTPPTVRRILADRDATVLQHGWQHRDNTSGERKRTELVDGMETLADDLAHGAELLRSAFGARFRKVMVPPWNRIDPGIRARLAGLGFAGLSAHGVRRAGQVDGLHVANAHIDLMDWRASAFAGEDAVLDQAVGHLALRRQGAADANEPTGLMTHHRVHDRDAAAFLDRFVTVVRDHGAAQWLHAAVLFGVGQVAA